MLMFLFISNQFTYALIASLFERCDINFLLLMMESISESEDTLSLSCRFVCSSDAEMQGCQRVRDARQTSGTVVSLSV